MNVKMTMTGSNRLKEVNSEDARKRSGGIVLKDDMESLGLSNKKLS